MSQAKRRVPHVFKSWQQISSRIRAAKNIRLFLDFDGTLVSIRPVPEDVKLTEETRAALASLSRHSKVHVVMVSGRRNSALRKYIRLRRVGLLGLYGWEREEGMALPARTRKKLPCVRATLATLPALFPGVWIEDKGVSFGIHFRGSPAKSVRGVQTWARKFLARIREDFGVIYGNRAWEIVPRHVKGKGAALREYLKSVDPPFLPIYLGDDVTDEPAFRQIRRGIAIRVGTDAPTSAHFRLKDPEEARAFLERLREELH